MAITKIRLILIIIEFIYILIEILTLFYIVWMTKAIKILFYIIFGFNIIHYVHAFIISLKSYYNNYFKFCFYLVLFIFFFNFLFGFIILSINISKYLKYWKNCPYLIKDLDYDLYFERRCELYNINNNSRYSYQYICSYDSSKDFKTRFQNEIKNDNIICIPLKKTEDNNEIITLFNNKYTNSTNYYCSRTNIPDNYSFVNQKNCVKTKYSWMITLYIFCILRFLIYPIIMKYVLFNITTIFIKR